MIGPELQRLLQILSPASGAAIDQTFRALRGAGSVPTSPRGRGMTAAPDMGPEHASLALMMLAIDQAPEKAVKVVSQWAGMRGADARTFHGKLEGILCDTGCELGTIEVRICREWPQARIISGDPSKPEIRIFGLSTAADVKAAGFRPTVIRSEFVLSGGALHQIACDLASPDGALFWGTATIAEGVA